MAEDPTIGVDERPLDDAALEALATAHATPPPAGLRSRVLEEALRGSVLEGTARSLIRWRLVGSLAAVLALAFGTLLARSSHLASQRGVEYAALIGANRELQLRLDEQERRLIGLRASLAAQTQVLRVMGGPLTVEAALSPSKGIKGRGRVMVDAASGETAIVIADMAPAGEAKVYELWAIRGDRAPEPAGVFTVGDEGSVATVGARIARPTEVTTFAVSIEPAGGSQTPTGPIVLVGQVSGKSG
jgi:anti-sigma-K factor RskA